MTTMQASISSGKRVLQEELNTDTENLIIVWYFNYSGGKTLCNMLGLNDQALFMDKDLAIKQMQGQFTVEDKMNYIRTELGKMQKGVFWTDLNLSCDRFMGFKKEEYVNPWRGLRFNEFVKDVTNSDYKFFHGSHDHRQIEAMMKVWKNPKIILMDHVHDFIIKRTKGNPQLKRWLDMLPSFEGELEKMLQIPNVVYRFDTRAYENEEFLLEEVAKLYDILGLPNYNKEYISEYYRLWYNKVEELKST